MVTFFLLLLRMETLSSKSVSSLGELFVVDYAIRLETMDQSLLGGIQKVSINEDLGLVFVLDRRSTKTVKVFRKDGRFVNSIGSVGQGPGEYQSIQDFVQTVDGVFVASPLKLIHYDHHGVLIKEMNMGQAYFPYSLINVDNKILVRNVYSKKPNLKAIFVYDRDFNELANFGEYEPELETYAYLVKESFDFFNNHIYVLPFYSLNLKSYQNSTYSLSHEVKNVGVNQAKLADYFQDRPFTEQSRTKISDHVHRYGPIYALEDFLIFYESVYKPESIHRMVIMDKSNKMTIIRGYHPLNWSDYQDKDLLVQNLVGHHKNHLIGVLEDDENFDAFKARYPNLKNLDLSVEDNPALVFLRLRKDILK